MSIEKKLTGVEKELADLEEQKKALLVKRLEETKRKKIECKGCKQSSQLSKWTFVYDQSYDSNLGDPCRGGEWSRSEVKYGYIRCPKCGANNRLINHLQQGKVLEAIKSEGWDGVKKIFTKVEDRPIEEGFSWQRTKPRFEWV